MADKKKPGRPPAAQNKTSRKVKECLIQTFENMGGTRAMTAWAKKNPGEFYRMWVRILPQEVHAKGGPNDEPIKILLQYPTRKNNPK